MNIESTTLLTGVPAAGVVENVSAPLVDGVVVSEGFSEALMAQMELLTNLKIEDSEVLQSPQSPDQVVVQNINVPPSVDGLTATAIETKTDAQNLAALLGNDLPPSYKTNDEVDHEAALAAVTDTFKYIASGNSDVDKAARAEQNIQNVMSIVVPSSPPSEQEIEDAVTVTAAPATAPVFPQQNIPQDTVDQVVPVELKQKPVESDTVPVEPNRPDMVVVVAEQAQTDATVQVKVEQPSGNPEQQVNTETTKTQAPAPADKPEQNIDELLAAIVLPTVVPTVVPAEQAKQPVNNLTSSDAVTHVVQEDVPQALIKSSMEDKKSSQIPEVPAEIVKSGTVARQPEQARQSFNLRYLDAVSGQQPEKTVQVEQQQGLNLNVDGEKALPRIGNDIIQPNKPVIDAKADVPAITKPLTHPEWNKDIGERIVWMSSKAIPSAEIRLNPQHLGPVSVRVDVSDDKASVMFTSQHAVVRETLEASIPKLREMMSSHQLDLVEVNISQGSVSDQGRSQSQTFAQTSEQGQGLTGSVSEGVDDVEQEIDSGRAVVSKGLLSLYA
jgi:flagellar hook-length control protein FliK